jgi:hypothetical protein
VCGGLRGGARGSSGLLPLSEFSDGGRVGTDGPCVLVSFVVGPFYSGVCCAKFTNWGVFVGG